MIWPSSLGRSLSNGSESIPEKNVFTLNRNVFFIDNLPLTRVDPSRDRAGRRKVAIALNGQRRFVRNVWKFHGCVASRCYCGRSVYSRGRDTGGDRSAHYERENRYENDRSSVQRRFVESAGTIGARPRKNVSSSSRRPHWTNGGGCSSAARTDRAIRVRAQACLL